MIHQKGTQYEKTGERDNRHSSLVSLDEKPFVIMGVINVTPDSFYDGGKHGTAEAALAHARILIREGADILDIGGESSRPGSLPVSADEELQRVTPLIEALRRETDIPISIDTTKAVVADQALHAGATWINDISAGRFDSRMAACAAARKCPVILMHSRKTPHVMQQDPVYGNVVAEVIGELMISVKSFTDCGVSAENIILDPGIGFAKRFEHTMVLIRNLSELIKTGFPVLVGTSRKSFVGAVINKEPEERLFGTLGSVAAAYNRGVKMFRVHDVAQTRDFLSVLSAIDAQP